MTRAKQLKENTEAYFDWVAKTGEIISEPVLCYAEVIKRLENAGMLTVRTAEHDGRLRKYYRITAAGLRRLEDFVAEWAEIISIYRFVTEEVNRE